MIAKEVDAENFGGLLEEDSILYHVIGTRGYAPDPEQAGPDIYNKIESRPDLFLMKTDCGDDEIQAEIMYPRSAKREASITSVPVWDDGLVYTTEDSRDWDPRAVARHLLYHSEDDGFDVEMDNENWRNALG